MKLLSYLRLAAFVYHRAIIAMLALVVAFAFGTGVAYATTGFWKKPTTCNGNPCLQVDYPATGAAAPNDKQPDGGVIGRVAHDAGGFYTEMGLGPQSGFDLYGLSSFTVTVAINGASPLDAGGTFTAGSLQAYYFSFAANRWSRAPDLDLTVASGNASQSFYGFTVTSDMGRIAYVPSGIGQPTSVFFTGRLK